MVLGEEGSDIRYRLHLIELEVRVSHPDTPCVDAVGEPPGDPVVPGCDEVLVLYNDSTHASAETG